jgi:hypothetical protein
MLVGVAACPMKQTLPEPKRFIVQCTQDWNSVAEYLLQRATSMPLDHADSERYSATDEEAWQNTDRWIDVGRAEEAVRYTAVVEYHGQQTISLVLTREPGVLHLSIVRLTLAGTKAVSDAVANEAARQILGTYQERQEGVMKIRHFYQVIA